MCGAQRSKHTHERGVEKCLALIKTTPEVFADNATERVASLSTSRAC